MKHIVLLAFASLFLLSAGIHLENSAQIVNNPYELVVATIGEPDSVDPAWAYSTGRELIFNVYETLIFYDRESVDEFVPMLATDWWISSDGLTYTFKIREGVKFHSYLYRWTLTTEDVEYSFERVMVYGRGCAWTLYDALLNVWKANLTDPMFGQKIDDAVQRNDTHVWFKLAQPYAPLLKVLCQPGCSIVNKEFCVMYGDWSGTWDNWQDFYYDPNIKQNSPLDDPEPVMCGTGPYKFNYWIEGDKWSIVKFDDYWGGWPAQHPVLGIQARGYVERATVQLIDEWSTRKLMFLAGDVDIAYVPRAYISEVFDQPEIRCVYPLPRLYCSGVFFNYNISLRSRYLGPPFTGYECDYGELNENGLPPDFFSDVDVRKGFAYSINYTEFLQALASHPWYGEYLYPGTPAIAGLLYGNPEQEKYEFNPAKAEEHFRKAWNGQLWTTGFDLTIFYTFGNVARETIAKMLEANIESINAKFHIRQYTEEWGTIYIPEMFNGELPLFQIGWEGDGDYPDLHIFFYYFVHSEALFPKCQRYSDPTVDALIGEGLHTLNETRRMEIYYGLQHIYFEDCPSVTIYQPLGRHWERVWVQGWYYNPAYPGLYFYHLWKEDLPPENLNQDGTVNILDVVVAAQAFASFCHLPDVHPRWDSRADFNHDQQVNILDIAAIAKKFGSQTLPWQPP